MGGGMIMKLRKTIDGEDVLLGELVQMIRNLRSNLCKEQQLYMENNLQFYVYI